MKVQIVALVLAISVSARAQTSEDKAEIVKGNTEAVKKLDPPSPNPSSGITKPAEKTDHGITDTTYGRIDGDLSVVLGLGATLAPRGPRATMDFRIRYIDTIGAFATYEEGPLVGSGTDPRRVFSTGLEVRPLFIGRWLEGREWGSARADLTLDSLGLELGAFFAEPQGAAFGSRPGFQLGLGMETPILRQASGPWIALHAGARWSDTALGGGRLDGPVDRSLYFTITVAWHQFCGAHVVDVGDKAPK